jgi:hypothetical protein
MTVQMLDNDQHVNVDGTQWPVMTLVLPPSTNDESIDICLDFYKDLVDLHKEKFALILDIRQVEHRLTTKQRKKIQDMATRYQVCTALVLKSTVFQQVISSALWFRKPVFPTRVFSEMNKAKTWAKSQIFPVQQDESYPS